MMNRPSGATHRDRVWISVWDWFCDRSYSLWGRKQWTRRTHRHCGKALAPMCWSVPCPPEGRLRQGFANVAALSSCCGDWAAMADMVTRSLNGNALDRKTLRGACNNNCVFGNIHTDVSLRSNRRSICFTAARFFIDVWSVGGRVLTKSVRNLADASRCPSTPALPSFARMSRKHHASLSKDLIRASLNSYLKMSTDHIAVTYWI